MNKKSLYTVFKLILIIVDFAQDNSKADKSLRLFGYINSDKNIRTREFFTI